jgi:AraC-like DNA-binding protein
MVGDVESKAMRRVSRESEALRLLTNYTGILRECSVLTSPELRHLATMHIYDLIAAALGTTRDGAASAEVRGIRAARLRAVKADILAHVGASDLAVDAVAQRQHVTSRYVHMLFEAEGVTFSEFILGQRLTRAHRMLADPRHRLMSISAIAFAAGFGDLSYFNRTFRRHFGATPSEVRLSAGRASPRTIQKMIFTGQKFGGLWPTAAVRVQLLMSAYCSIVLQKYFAGCSTQY